MNYRNAKILANGWIDCEIEHPTYGWIPFTCDPLDIGTDLNSAELHAIMLSDARTIPYIAPSAEQLQAEILESVRANMRCTRMQGILALGETNWSIVLEYYKTATWAEKIIIDNASDWVRNSENIQFFAYLLNLSPTDVDRLFTNAMSIVA